MMAEQFTAAKRLDEASFATGISKVHARIKQHVIDKVSDIYCESFTDAELDEIMIFTNSAVGTKMRVMLPYIQERMMAIFIGPEIDMEKIFDEVFTDLLESETATS